MMKGPQKVLLSKLGTLKKGGAILREKLRPEGAAVILYGDIYTKYSEIVTRMVSRVDPSAVVDGVRLNDGDIIFAGSGETAEEIGKCIAYVGNEEAYAGGDVVILSNHGQDARYLGYALNAEDAIRQKMRLGQGSSVMHLYKEDVGSIQIPLPPLAEQRKIAEILRTWDEAIETAEAELKAKQERKRGVTLKLLNPSGEGAGAVMANWTKVHLGSLVDANVRWSFSGGPFGSNLKASDYTEDGVRIIQLQNIGEGVFNDEYKIFTSESKADDLIANNIYPGEIIFSKMGDPVARACIVPCGAPRYVMASDGIRFKPDPKKADVYFLLNYVNCAAFRKAAESVSSGSTRMRIGLDELRMLEIPLPPLVEQRKIAEVLLSEDEGIDSLKAKANLLRAQKRGLMQKLLTGEVRVAA